MQAQKKIGVLDSGLGGLTVVKELLQILPGESIVYFGDNANCPYGNRSREEILKLSSAMLDFLRERGVKIAAIACNTISTLIEPLRRCCEFPIVSIIEAASEYVAAMKLSQAGLFATEFTIRQGLYEKLIQKIHPKTKVYGQASRTLAALVDSGEFDSPAAKAEVASLLHTIKEAHPALDHIVLGCTHYPIVQGLFEQAAPDIKFINPAEVQAKAVQALLLQRGLLAETPEPCLDIFTSGNKTQYRKALKKLKIQRQANINIIKY